MVIQADSSAGVLGSFCLFCNDKRSPIKRFRSDLILYVWIQDGECATIQRFGSGVIPFGLKQTGKAT